LLYGQFYVIRKDKPIIVSENKLKYCGEQQYHGETKFNFFDEKTHLFHWLLTSDVKMYNAKISR